MEGADWVIPRIWEGSECYILGGGPGLKEVNLDALKGKHVIAVNNAYQLGDWPVMLYGDCAWYKTMRGKDGLAHSAALARWGGLKVHPCKDGCTPPGIKIARRRSKPFGICRQANRISWNLSSGACAIDLAAHFGVSRIILLGFDMSSNEGAHNWHQEHGVRPPKFNPYPNHLKAFPAIAHDLKTCGIECLNATPGSAIDCLPIVEKCEVGL
jgi:hypothetical protein